MKPQRAKIVALAKKRVRPTQISEDLGVHINTVYEAIRNARRAGDDIPIFSTSKRRDVLVLNHSDAPL